MSAGDSVDVQISKEEAALYDRQIRLWGLEAQKRLRSSKVLLAGVNGLGAEISKNIVLAGINSLTLVDNCIVSVGERSAQFLISRDDSGKNRAESSLTRLQNLNPTVQITALAENVADMPDSFYDEFDVVCVINQPVNVLQKIDSICRSKGKFFLAGDTFGYFGCCFFDFGGSHEYAEDVVTKVPVQDDTAEPHAKKPKMEEIIKTVKKKSSFSTLETVQAIDWQVAENAEKLKKLTNNFFIYQVMQKFRATKGRNPEPSHRDEDQEYLHQLAGEMTNTYGLPEDKIGSQFISLCFAELAPVCAIVGGVVAQEIIKAVSYKDKPLNNFFFHTLDGEGLAELIN